MGDLSRWPELVPLIVAAAWCHGPASPLLPAAFEPVLMAYGRSFSPLLLALIATVVSVGMETINYLGYGYLLRQRRLVRVQTASARLTRLFARSPFLLCLLVAATPLPDWSARVLGALARYSPRRYLLAFALGRVPKFWLLATVGHQLRVGKPLLISLVVGSVLVTLASRFTGAACARVRAGMRSTATAGLEVE
jgi:membrane protein YqaA with SNARE-associated domain